MNYATQSVIPAGTAVYIQLLEQSKLFISTLRKQKMEELSSIINGVVVLSIAE
jgi:hypothetical protein